MNKKKKKQQQSNENISFNFQVKHRLTRNQESLLGLLDDEKTKILFLDAPAGTSKTYLAVLAALKAIQSGKKSKCIYIRNPVESSEHGIGFLPGDGNEKISPYGSPLFSKLGEFVDQNTCNIFLRNKIFEVKPVGFLRGEDFKDSFIIIDEAQNLTSGELKTALTRLGKNSLIFVIGDSEQSDIKKSGFREVFMMFGNNQQSNINGIFCQELSKKDILREGVIKYILEVFEESSRYLNKKS